MKRKTRYFIVEWVLLWAVTPVWSAWTPGPLIDLGDVTPTAINDNGQIVGYRELLDAAGNPYKRAVLIDPTGLGNHVDLGALGGSASEALDINDLGQIVGWAQTADGQSHATLFDPAGNIDLDPFGQVAAQTESRASLINNLGHIVQTSSQHYSLDPSWLLDPTGQGNNTNLGYRVFDINNTGKASADGTSPINGEVAPFFIDLTSQQATQIWPEHEAPPTYYAIHITDQNRVFLEDGLEGAWHWWYDIDTDGSEPFAGGTYTLPDGTLFRYWNVRTMNDNNQWTGTLSSDHSGFGDRIVAFSDEGTVYRIGDIMAAYGWRGGPLDMNNHAWWVGTGINPDGETHGFLLIPEPITAILLISGILILGRRIRFTRARRHVL